MEVVRVVRAGRGGVALPDAAQFSHPFDGFQSGEVLVRDALDDEAPALRFRAQRLCGDRAVWEGDRRRFGKPKRRGGGDLNSPVTSQQPSMRLLLDGGCDMV